MKFTKVLLGLLLVCLVFAVSGCEKDGSSGTNNQGKQVTDIANKQRNSTADHMEIKVYYPNNEATKLVAVKKEIKAEGNTKYRGAVEALMEEPKDSNLTAIFPKQAKLLGVTVSGDTAKVDFDKALVEKFNGGSTGEEMLVGAIVNTLTEFSEIKKVQILIEGKKIESIKGHVDTSQPLARMDDLLK